MIAELAVMLHPDLEPADAVHAVVLALDGLPAYRIIGPPTFDDGAVLVTVRMWTCTAEREASAPARLMRHVVEALPPDVLAVCEVIR